MEHLSQQELAVRSGTSPDRIALMVDLGIIPRPADGYDPKDLLRVRLALAIESSGVSLQDLGRGIAEGHVSLDFAAYSNVPPVGLLGKTYRDLAVELGVSAELVERIRSALGLIRGSLDDAVREDDAEVLEMAVRTMSFGIPEDVVMRGTRVYGENIRRLVEYELEMIRTEFEMPMLQSGIPEQAMLDSMAQVRAALEPIAGRFVEILHRQYEERAFFQDVIEHMERALEKAGVSPTRPTHPPAISFLDLTGFARLTEESGDLVAAELAGRLADLVELTAKRHGGRPVKLLGDGVMFHFPDPAGAVLCGLDLVERTPQASLPPSRVGIDAGPVVARDGDYFGRTVNLAARIADYAGPSEVIVSDAVSAAGPVEGVTFSRIGRIELKGLLEPVMLHRALWTRA
jgi:adenylate cyclase